MHSAFCIPKTGMYTYPLQCYDIAYQALLLTSLLWPAAS